MSSEDSVTRFVPVGGPDPDDGGPVISVIGGQASGSSFPLVQGETFAIGRRPENDLVLASPAVSKHHARIVSSGGESAFHVEDLGSTNGTLVNQIRLEPGTVRALYHGDILTLGDHTLVFRHGRAGFTDQTGLSTISFDVDKVKEEADRFMDDWLSKNRDED